ncbi:MAG: hypothetical protein R2744_12130 [Bacteroidales bacterium]
MTCFDEEKDAAMKIEIDKERNRIMQEDAKEGGSAARPAGTFRRTL